MILAAAPCRLYCDLPECDLSICVVSPANKFQTDAIIVKQL